MPDHTHILIGMRPYQSISSLIQNVKSESTKWVNEHKFCRRRFEWQDGYGAFSYSRSQVGSVVKYIQNQEVHHKKKTFLQEYREFLDAFEVDWNPEYIFHELV